MGGIVHVHILWENFNNEVVFIIIMIGLLIFVFCKSSNTTAAEEYGVVF